MKTIYIVTSNKNKALSIKKGLLKYGINAKYFNLELPEPRSYDITEIAKTKVLYAYKKLKKPCIVLDSGFFINSLNGFPRTFINYALDTVGIDGILKLTEHKEKSCEFRECLAYLDIKTKKPVIFESEVKGTLSKSIRGQGKPFHWSKLSLIFIPKGKNKTLAQMSKKEYELWYKNYMEKYSYLKKFAKWFNKI